MKLVSLPYESKQLEWIFQRRCISLVVQGKNSSFPFRLGSWCGSYTGATPVPERKGERKGTTLAFVLRVSVVNSGQRNGNLRGKQGGGGRLWCENWWNQPQTDPQEWGERDSPARGIALLPAETWAPWGLVLALPRLPSRETGTASLGKVLYRCFITMFPFTYNTTFNATPYAIDQCPSLLLRKQGRRF